MKYIIFLFCILSFVATADDRPWPPLPSANATAEIPAQEWPRQPGPRTVKTYVFYPGNSLENVDANTGLFLALHYWSGTGSAGAPDPQTLADRYNVVAISVDYLQSGKDWMAIPPYDYGYLQGLDALRSLYWVYNGLRGQGKSFNAGRIYCAGYSGGGNVTQMANKMAPRTFAAIFDFCGMAKLSDDIAYGLPGGSRLNAGYSQDPENTAYLSPDAQVLRDLGNRSHLEQMKDYGLEAHIYVIHGSTDDVCPVADKREVVKNMEATGLTVTATFPEEKDLDGVIFSGTGHSLGNPTKIVEVLADDRLLVDSETALIRKGKADFERKDILCYTTPNGCWEISYEAGYPVGRMREE